jgi:steroid delta-isomerase-like uncharacterized protein
MSTAQNQELTRRFIEGVLNTGNMAAADDYLASDFVEHSAPPGFPGNREGVKMVFTMLHTTFPDFRYVIEDTIVAGDLVVHRITGHGTMQGSFFGLPATGKHASWPEVHIARVKDGKIVEHWDVIDRLTRLQQLGLAPIPGQPGDETRYARLVTGQIAPDKLDEAIRLWQESVAPSVKQQKGFKSARLLVERKTGKVASMGLWETEADFQGTVEWNQAQLAKFAGLFTVPPSVEGYEVVAEVLRD